MNHEYVFQKQIYMNMFSNIPNRDRIEIRKIESFFESCTETQISENEFFNLANRPFSSFVNFLLPRTEVSSSTETIVFNGSTFRRYILNHSCYYEFNFEKDIFNILSLLIENITQMRFHRIAIKKLTQSLIFATDFPPYYLLKPIPYILEIITKINMKSKISLQKTDCEDIFDGFLYTYLPHKEETKRKLILSFKLFYKLLWKFQRKQFSLTIKKTKYLIKIFILAENIVLMEFVRLLQFCVKTSKVLPTIDYMNFLIKIFRKTEFSKTEKIINYLKTHISKFNGLPTKQKLNDVIENLPK